MTRARQILGALQKSWLLLFAGASVLIAFIYLDDIIRELRQPLVFRVQYLLLALLFQIAFWVVLAFSWQRVVWQWSNTRLPLQVAYLHSALVGLGKYIPGKIWGAIARGMHLGQHGISAGEAATATLHEQILLLHGGLIVGAFSAAILLKETYLWSLVAMLLASAPLGERFSATAFHYLSRLATRLGHRVTMGSRANTGTAGYLVLLSQYSLLWIVSGLMLTSLYLCCLGGTINTTLLAALILANTSGIVFGFIAIFAPGGIGVREVTVVAVLAPVMGVADAVLLSIVSRLWFVAMDLAGGGMALVIRATHSPKAR